MSKDNKVSKLVKRSEMRPEFKDRNTEIHARWVEANDLLEKAKLSKRKQSIEKAENLIDQIAGEFYTVNRGLAIAAARPFINVGDVNGDDYISAASLGLWEAFKKWDPTKGVTFGTFSRQYIKGRLVRSVRATEYGHISQTDFNRRKDVRDTLSRLREELGREVSNDEIAKVLSLPVDAVRRALAPAASSLDAPISAEDGGRTLGDSIADSMIDEDKTLSILSSELDEEVVQSLLDELNDLELWIVGVRGELNGSYPQSLAEIADDIGVGREITRRAEAKAKARLMYTKFCIDNGRLPSNHELAKLLDTTIDKAVALVKPTWGDLHSRWVRATKGVNPRAMSNGSLKARTRRNRIDRIGEEVLSHGFDLYIEAGKMFVNEDGNLIGYDQAAYDLWEAFRTWSPKTDPQFTAWVRRYWSSKYVKSSSSKRKLSDLLPVSDVVTVWGRVKAKGIDFPN